MSGLAREGQVWVVRKTVPADVRATLGRREFQRSTGTRDLREAQAIRDELDAKWSAEIVAARKAVAHEPINLDGCRAALGLAMMAGVFHRTGWGDGPDPWPAEWRRLTAAGPLDTNTAPPLALVIVALRHAVDTGDHTHVPGLEEITAHLVRVHPSHPQWAEVRAVVAQVWLATMEGAERDRLVGAHSAAAERLRDDAQLPISVEAPVYQPRAGDRTVKELVDVFKVNRNARYGEESTERKYAHIFAALEEVLGGPTPLRSLTRADGRKLRDFLRRVPTHAGKRYRGLKLAEAVANADSSKTPVERLSQNTVNSYISNLSAMINFAIAEEWMERRIAAGLVEKNKPKVKRRGFTSEELVKVFAPLNGWRRWYYGLLLYSGARASEIAQLRRGDVREQDGVLYLALSEFDEAGRRVDDKSLKTSTSTRNIPVHAALIDAGIRPFLTAQNDPNSQAWPEIKQTVDGWSHDVSRWFAAHLDRMGLTDPALVMHSFRHGFRDAGRRAGLETSMIDALAGWASASVGEGYGDRGMIAVLKRELDRIDYGEFTLANQPEQRVLDQPPAGPCRTAIP